MTARLRVTVLGCGASPGVPRIGNDWGACDPNEPRNVRTRCSLLIERFGNGPAPSRVLVDTGPDLRAQLLAAGVGAIDGVVYTHSHADHLHGIDDLRAFWLNTRRLIDVYADAHTEARLDAGFGYCFAAPPGSFYPPILRHRQIAPGTPFSVEGAGGAIELMPLHQIHGDDRSLGFRVGGLAYSCDVSDLPDETVERLAGLDVWVVGALRYQPHPSHFTVDQALAWIDRIKPRRAILTHLHADLDYRKLEGSLPKNVAPAYDGMTIDLAG